MIEIQGKHNKGKIYTNNVKETAISQVYNILNDVIAKDSDICFMPDIHAGMGVPIGTSIRLPKDKSQWKVCPDIVSGDIGCGMIATKLDLDTLTIDDFRNIDKAIYEHVPTGPNIFDYETNDKEIIDLVNNRLITPLDDFNKSGVLCSLGTLGGGNHFIEISIDEEGYYWLVIHSGSRKFGQLINSHHMKVAKKNVHVNEANKIIDKLKSEGRFTEIEKKLLEHKAENKNKDRFYYLEGKALDDYLNDMDIGVKFANRNREIMSDNIIKAMGWENKVIDRFQSIHNYMDTENGIIRKGSTEANEGQRLIIPLNMKEGSLICVGKGNTDWNNSAPHGAGRKLSRSEAKASISLEDYKKSMEGIYSDSITESTIDESVFAYKSMDDIVNNIEDSAEVINHIKPVYNAKAH